MWSAALVPLRRSSPIPGQPYDLLLPFTEWLAEKNDDEHSLERREAGQTTERRRIRRGFPLDQLENQNVIL